MQRSDPPMIGLDLNATRARAVSASRAGPARTLPLDDSHHELPMFLSLERRQPQVGQPGLALCRQIPHLTCADFLAQLGQPRVWKTSRGAIDAGQALALVFKHMTPVVSAADAVVVALPSYLSRTQAGQVLALMERLGWPPAVTVAAPLAAALASQRQRPLTGPAILVDVDDHAFSGAYIVPDEGRLHAQDWESAPALSLRAWKEVLLNAVAERCVRRSRRDPRDSGSAEQSLYEQLEGVLAACAQGRPADLTIQTAQWYQDLILKPEEVIRCTKRLTEQAVAEVQGMLRREVRPAPAAVVLTAAAGLLPGLPAALQEAFGQAGTPDPGEENSDDFGENLIPAYGGNTTLEVLPVDAVAQAACDLALAARRGQVPRGHLDTAVPVPAATFFSRRFGTIA